MSARYLKPERHGRGRRKKLEDEEAVDKARKLDGGTGERVGCIKKGEGCGERGGSTQDAVLKLSCCLG